MKHPLQWMLVRAPFSSVIEYTADFFAEHPDLDVKALASSSAHVTTQYEVTDDRTDATRRHDALDLSWTPRWPWFPRFEGHLTVRPQDSYAMLGIEWSYVPPGGFFGRLFDRVAGARLARGTVDHLLRRLCRYVEKRYRDFQASLPTIEELNDPRRAD